MCCSLIMEALSSNFGTKTINLHLFTAEDWTCCSNSCFSNLANLMTYTFQMISGPSTLPRNNHCRSFPETDVVDPSTTNVDLLFFSAWCTGSLHFSQLVEHPRVLNLPCMNWMYKWDVLEWGSLSTGVVELPNYLFTGDQPMQMYCDFYGFPLY